MASSVRHIIFDFDGTLIDSAPDLAAAVDGMLAELSLPPAGLDKVKLWIGNGAAKLVERALAQQTTSFDTTLLNQAIPVFYRHYQSCLAKYSQLYEGVLEGLNSLKEQGFELSLCTNKPEQFTAPLLEHFNLNNLFRFVIFGDSLSHKKPHPEPLLWLCQQTQMKPNETLMVGDSMSDVKAAQAANMTVACVDYGYAQGADLGRACNDLVYKTFPLLVNDILNHQIADQVTAL